MDTNNLFALHTHAVDYIPRYMFDLHESHHFIINNILVCDSMAK